jgi:imidazolonepropionase-like amidohydrolase
MNSRNLRGTSFALATVRNPGRMLLPPLLWVTLSIGVCQRSLGQHKALELGPEEAAPTLPAGGVKALEVFAGTETAEKLAKKYRVKTAWSADIPGDAGAASRQGQYLAMMVRWYTPAEALKMATAHNGELMALSGYINPYPGKLGVVEVGALADLLLVDGNPLEDINLVANRGKNFVVVMKDGKI